MAKICVLDRARSSCSRVQQEVQHGDRRRHKAELPGRAHQAHTQDSAQELARGRGELIASKHNLNNCFLFKQQHTTLESKPIQFFSVHCFIFRYIKISFKILFS